MSCIKKIQIEDTVYTANTDFRVAIECNRIAEDETIGNFERVLAIIYTMFGEEGLSNPSHYEKLINWILKYLSCGKEIENKSNEIPDMDYIEDMNYIEASFMSDYQIDLTETEMDWQKFSKLMNGLSNSEFGNCCVLNRIRNLRNYDLKDIKDPKEKKKIQEAKNEVALKKYQPKKKEATKEQKESARKLYEMLGIGRK